MSSSSHASNIPPASCKSCQSVIIQGPFRVICKFCSQQYHTHCRYDVLQLGYCLTCMNILSPHDLALPDIQQPKQGKDFEDKDHKGDWFKDKGRKGNRKGLEDKDQKGDRKDFEDKNYKGDRKGFEDKDRKGNGKDLKDKGHKGDCKDSNDKGYEGDRKGFEDKDRKERYKL